jgi:CRISPR/Cas system-associated protein Cas7 (RAMP superfamily)
MSTLNLTQQQEDAINTTASTHDYFSQYEAEAHGDEDHSDYFTEAFEADTSVLKRSVANDVGGIIIYMNKRELVAYFDYENLCGTVFA